MAYQHYSPQLGCKYTLTAANGWKAVFNDPSDPDYVGMLSDITGLDGADIRESSEDLVESDGAQHGNFYQGRRPITMSAVVASHATLTSRDLRIDKARRVLNQMLRTDGVLSWTNEPIASNLPMQTWVRKQQRLQVSGNWTKEILISLVSQYPQLFGSTPRTSGEISSGSTVVVENRGDLAAYPVVRLKGASSNPTISNTTYGQVFYTNGLTIASGETLTVDFYRHTATFTSGARNGQSGNRYINFASTIKWPSISSGNNTFSMSGGGSFIVEWLDTWG